MIKILMLELDLTNAPAGRFHRLCTAAQNITYNGYEWLAVGDLLEVDDLQNTCEIASLGTTITLSGIDPNYRSEIDANGFNNAPITLFTADLVGELNTVENVTIVHSGTCDTPVTEVDYESGTMTIAVSTISIWGDLEKKPDLSRNSFATHSATHCYNSNGDFEPDEFYKFVASVADEEDWIS